MSALAKSQTVFETLNEIKKRLTISVNKKENDNTFTKQTHNKVI